MSIFNIVKNCNELFDFFIENFDRENFKLK